MELFRANNIVTYSKSPYFYKFIFFQMTPFLHRWIQSQTHGRSDQQGNFNMPVFEGIKITNGYI